MRFGLSAEQRELAQTVARLLSEQFPLEVVRTAAEGDPVPREALSSALAELGVFQMAVPEPYGGLGLGMLDIAVVCEALGAAVAPVAFVAPYVMAPLALGIAGDERQREGWLPRIAAGEARIAVGLGEYAGARDTAGVRLDGDRASGEALFVLDCADASAYLIGAADGTLCLVAADDPGVRLTTLTTVDRTRAFGVLELDGAGVEPLRGKRSPAAIGEVVHAGRIALAADTLGAAQAMLDKSVAYALERRQFNRVIGSFQAVKHMCSEMAANLEPCRAMLWHAAYAYDALPDEAALLACQVKAHLGDVGQRVARTATEVHGGMGFTDLLGLHYWFKRIGVNRQALGGPTEVRAEVARLQGWIA